ncbi:MAG TPA: hypothetical protein VNL92_07605, partial [Dehalococcoidia bacterium]|nr:hypothetical protein [Dehalococcoidia bacterium]
IDVIEPRAVVSLGSVALASLAAIEPHGLSLRQDVGRVVAWYGRLLVPLYHPSPQTRAARSDAQQASDYRRLGLLLEPALAGTR